MESKCDRTGRTHHHAAGTAGAPHRRLADRKSTRLNSSHLVISYAVFCLKKKKSARHPDIRASRADCQQVATLPRRIGRPVRLYNATSESHFELAAVSSSGNLASELLHES